MAEEKEDKNLIKLLKVTEELIMDGLNNYIESNLLGKEELELKMKKIGIPLLYLLADPNITSDILNEFPNKKILETIKGNLSLLLSRTVNNLGKEELNKLDKRQLEFNDILSVFFFVINKTTLRDKSLIKEITEKKVRDKIPLAIRLEVLKRDNFRCTICGKTNKEISLEVDHIIPVGKGGTDTIENLQTLCKECNLGKSGRII